MVQTKTTLYHTIVVGNFQRAGGKVVLRTLGMGEAAGSIPAQSIFWHVETVDLIPARFIIFSDSHEFLELYFIESYA